MHCTRKGSDDCGDAPLPGAAGGGSGGDSKQRPSKESPAAASEPAQEDQQQHCDVVLSPVFSQEEIDMLLDVSPVLLLSIKAVR